MNNIANEIVNDIEIKPSKNKFILKWVVRLSTILVIGAFGYGQFKTNRENNLNSIKKSIQENTNATLKLENKVDEGLRLVNSRVDKVYDDAFKGFYDFQEYNKKQLELMVDYGEKNKELLKKMLDVNSFEKTKIVESELENAKMKSVTLNKINNIEHNISFKYLNKEINGNDTTYYVYGATKEYIDSINKNKYEIKKACLSKKYLELFDVIYSNKNF